MAFDKIFKGSPVDEITPASPESPNLGVDVVNDTLYVNSGNGWVEVGGGGSGNLTGTLTPGNMPIASAAHTVVDGPISYDSNSDVVKILAAENVGTSLFIAANSGVHIDTIPGDDTPGLGGGSITVLSGAGIIISNFDQGPPSEGSAISITNNDTGGTTITDTGGGGITITGDGVNLNVTGGNGMALDGGSGNITFFSLTVPSTFYSAAGTPLPVASSPIQGARAFVSDATANVYGTSYASGGSIFAPVYCDGTTWKMG